MPLDFRTGWLVVSLLTFAAQLVLGTSAEFALASLAVFALFPVVFQVFRSVDNAGAVFAVATFGKIFMVSQWVKIGLGQAADSHLDAADQTALAILFGLAGFLLAGLAARQIVPHVRFCLMQPRNEPRFLLMIGLAAAAVAALGMAGRHLFMPEELAHFARPDLFEGTWEDLGESDVKPFAGWNYMIALLGLAVAAFTARRVVLSGRRRPLDGWVVAAIAAGILFGALDNNRTTMFSGLVAWGMTFLAYGGRIRFRHAAAGVVGLVLVQFWLFPFIDMQRSFRNLPTADYLAQSAVLADELFAGDRLRDYFEGDGTRLYYGRPMGLLDRFSPAQVADVVAFIDVNGTLGEEYLLYPFLHFVPRRVLAFLSVIDFDYPLAGGALIERLMTGSTVVVHLNMGLIDELYAYAGLAMLPLLTAVYLAIFLACFHLVFGGMRDNFAAAFGVTVFLFTIADTDAGNMFSRIASQGGLYAVFYIAASFALTRRVTFRSGHAP